MTDDANKQSTAERPLFYRPSPGYLRTKEIVERAKRLQDLIRHKERWGSDIDLAQPLEKLLPGIPESKRAQVIDQEISRLIRPVHWALNHFGIPTGVTYADPYALDPKADPKKYDLILDYFRLPRHGGNSYAPFGAVMRILNEGIGVFELHLRHARSNLANPVSWIAYLIRFPITVMERAGFIGNEKTEAMMLGAYARFVRIAMSVMLVLVALRLGITIPWKDLFAHILDIITK